MMVGQAGEGVGCRRGATSIGPAGDILAHELSRYEWTRQDG